MSLIINVYCKEVNKLLLPNLLKRLNDFDMIVEIHPNFEFSQENDSGYLPFKFKFKKTNFNVLQNKSLISGFEIYIDDFNYLNFEEKNNPKLSFFEKMLGKKKSEISFVEKETKNRLKDCKKIVSFVWGNFNDFELRFALLTSSILTELTNGVCSHPSDDIWYENKNIVYCTFEEIKDYENSLLEKELKYDEFEKW